jgi:hypothetical protein
MNLGQPEIGIPEQTREKIYSNAAKLVTFLIQIIVNNDVVFWWTGGP